MDGTDTDEQLVSLHGDAPAHAGGGRRPRQEAATGEAETTPSGSASASHVVAGQDPPAASALTDEALLRPAAAPPPRGWRRAAYRLTGGAVNLGPDAAELEQRELRARVRAPIGRGGMRVAVLSRKGGVGKTTVALLLGHTFAAERGDRVVALDANPDAGNLVARLDREHPATVSDLLADRARVERYADVRAYTSQAPSRLEAVAADDDPTVVEGLGAADYRDAVDLLGRHYNLLVVDTGTGVLAPATQGVLELADLVVIAAPTAVDRARVSYSTLDWLRANGYAHLADDAVVAITEVRGVDERVDPDAVEAAFAAGAGATVRIPWDSHLEAGARTQLDDLAAPTRLAYLRLAAAVADRFPAAAGRQPPIRRPESAVGDGQPRPRLDEQADERDVTGRTRVSTHELAQALTRRLSTDRKPASKKEERP